MPKLSSREWVHKYKLAVQNSELIELINVADLPYGEVGPWAFLKLAFLWSYAYYTYTPIIGRNYINMCYVDLFSGTGLSCFQDCSGNPQFMLGSPLLIATITSSYPFKKCFFFESDSKLASALDKRLGILKNNEMLTCKGYKIFSNCNKDIDELLNELRELRSAHFLLLVDPFSTEINWSTMEKLLALSYPSFDMIFNFQPFGVNRKSYRPETMRQFFGDLNYNKYHKDTDERTLDAWKDYYIQKLRQYPEKVKTIKTVRIRSGTGGFYYDLYYDLIYTTRKAEEEAPWARGIEHLKRTIEKLTGYEVSIFLDPSFRSLDDFFSLI